MSRLVFILVLWAGLIWGTMHYVGHVLPTTMQISEAKEEAAMEEAKELANPTPVASTPAAPAASAPAAASAGSAQPKASASAPTAATPAVAAASSTPKATAAGSAAAPAAGSGTAAKGPAKLPKDPLLAGYNRTAMTNVAIFYSIVISVLFAGVVILQIFKYKHIEEEAAH